MTARGDSAVLRGALHWARNHMEVGHPDEREKVLDRLGDVLAAADVGIADMVAFHKAYPPENYMPGKKRPGR